MRDIEFLPAVGEGGAGTSLKKPTGQRNKGPAGYEIRTL